jgi:hypothetical protein
LAGEHETTTPLKAAISDRHKSAASSVVARDKPRSSPWTKMGTQHISPRPGLTPPMRVSLPPIAYYFRPTPSPCRTTRKISNCLRTKAHRRHLARGATCPGVLTGRPLLTAPLHPAFLIMDVGGQPPLPPNPIQQVRGPLAPCRVRFTRRPTHLQRPPRRTHHGQSGHLPCNTVRIVGLSAKGGGNVTHSRPPLVFRTDITTRD